MKRFLKSYDIKAELTGSSPSACPSVLMSGNTIAGKLKMEGGTPNLSKWSLHLTVFVQY